MSIYVELTREFNEGGLRAILSSGQAVVLHRLAVMSKDGDWIVRETPEALDCVRGVLERRGAAYRFGAPLDVRWMAGGWSAHLEFAFEGIRIRTDFVTRPPRLSAEDLEGLWKEQAGAEIPCVDLRRLVELKKTNREKDYAVIGDLARRMTDPRDRVLASRSAGDLAALAVEHPELVRSLVRVRPLLARIAGGTGALEAALDAERRELMHRNERRLARYIEASGVWAESWPRVSRELAGLPLSQAHAAMVARAEGVLPFRVAEEVA